MTFRKASRPSMKRWCGQTFTLTILKLDDLINDIHRLSERCGWGGGGAGGDSHGVQAQIQGWTFLHCRGTLLLSLQLLRQLGVQLLQRLTALWTQSGESHTPHTLCIHSSLVKLTCLGGSSVFINDSMYDGVTLWWRCTNIRRMCRCTFSLLEDRMGITMKSLEGEIIIALNVCLQ